MRKRVPKALRARCCPNGLNTDLLDDDLKPFWTRVQNLEHRARQPHQPLQAAPDLRGHTPKSENRLPVEEMKRKSVNTTRRSVKPSGREERRSAQANSRANYPCRGFCCRLTISQSLSRILPSVGHFLMPVEDSLPFSLSDSPP